jgi:hypothetical protein
MKNNVLTDVNYEDSIEIQLPGIENWPQPYNLLGVLKLLFLFMHWFSNPFRYGELQVKKKSLLVWTLIYFTVSSGARKKWALFHRVLSPWITYRGEGLHVWMKVANGVSNTRPANSFYSALSLIDLITECGSAHCRRASLFQMSFITRIKAQNGSLFLDSSVQHTPARTDNSPLKFYM